MFATKFTAKFTMWTVSFRDNMSCVIYSKVHTILTPFDTGEMLFKNEKEPFPDYHKTVVVGQRIPANRIVKS